MCVCSRVWVHMYVHACEGPRLKSGIFLNCLYITLYTQMESAPPFQPAWSASLLQRSPVSRGVGLPVNHHTDRL